MPTFKTDGVVLRRENYREYDKIFTIYTKDYGKINATASGVRKVKSKQAGHLEPFTWSEFMFAFGTRRVNRLATSVTLNSFPRVRKSLSKISIANYCIDVLDSATHTDSTDSAVFTLLTHVLHALEKTEAYPQRDTLLGRVFAFKLLSHLGYKPELLNCIVCDISIGTAEPLFFNALQGGLLHKHCLTKALYSLPVDTSILAMLHTFLVHDFEYLTTLQVTKDMSLHLNQIMKSFVETHLERQLASEMWLGYQYETLLKPVIFPHAITL